MSQTYDVPVVPCLHSAIGVLKILPETVAYTLRSILGNPGKSFQASEKESVSIRQFIYKYEQSPDLLCSNFQLALQYQLNLLTSNPDRGEEVNVECEPQFYEDNLKYDVKITVSGQYIKNEQIIPFYESNIFEITADKVLQLKLEGTPYE